MLPLAFTLWYLFMDTGIFLFHNLTLVRHGAAAGRLWFYFRATLTSPARLASASPESLWQRTGETLTAKIHGTLPEKVVGFLHRER